MQHCTNQSKFLFAVNLKPFIGYANTRFQKLMMNFCKSKKFQTVKSFGVIIVLNKFRIMIV
nr:MAG TPA_asm: hypothetical protein [Caudoviricetes sp.]